MRRSYLAAVAVALAACQDQPIPVEPTPAPSLAVAASAASEVIPGRYIVVFTDEVQDAPGLARQLVAAAGGTLRYSYQHAIKGFAADLSDAAVSALQRNPNVAYVEQDQVVHAIATQSNATWGIDRVDQRALPLSTTYEYTSTGSGVRAYIIDTGIRFSHEEFGGRAVTGFDAVDGGSADDCNGHGTHVAGTVGGTVYGVAKGVTLVGVRVLDCSGSGSWSGVIAGVDWVTADHEAGAPAVANMSLGGGASESVDQAVRNSIADGVSYAIAAGNGNMAGIAQDACKYSPARVAEAMTIGATTKTDAKTSWSNYGSCVDWFAPGSGITSAWYTSNTATNTISGTSMAAPHVAGVAALYLQSNTGASPATVRQALYDATTKGIVTSSSTANNHLLYSPPAGFGGGGGGTDTPPSVSITSPTGGSIVVGTITVEANASDDNGVTQVEFFVDGVSIGVDASSAGGWSVSWNTTTVGDGSHSLTARATDTKPQTTTSVAVSVTVSNATSTPSGISLSANGYKVKGVQHVDLSWSGATSTSVDVYRDGTNVTTTENDGAHTDNIGRKGGGSYSYKVCEAGTTTCSSTVVVSF